MLCACRGSDYGQRTESKPSASDRGRFFFTSAVCNEIVHSLTQKHPEFVVDVVARAEVLAGNGDSGRADPCGSFTLARAYRYTGDVRFLDRLAEFAHNGAPNMKDGGCPSDDQDMVWRAARVISDTYAIHLIPDSGHTACGTLLSEVQSNCSTLARVRQSANPPARVMAAGAVAMACMSLPSLRCSDQRREWGLATMRELIGEYAYPTRPISLGERCLVAEMYLSLIVLSQSHRLEVPSHVLGGIEAVVDSIHQMPEAGVGGDGGELVLNIAPFESTGSSGAILALGAVLFDRQDLSDGDCGAAETLLWLTGIEGLEEYESLCMEGAPAPF